MFKSRREQKRPSPSPGKHLHKNTSTVLTWTKRPESEVSRGMPTEQRRSQNRYTLTDVEQRVAIHSHFDLEDAPVDPGCRWSR